MEDSVDFNTPLSYTDRQDSTGAQTAKSFKSVQTSFTEKGHGWECKACSMLNSMTDGECELCGAVRHVEVASAAASFGGNGSSSKSSKSFDGEKNDAVELHKRTASTATGSSKSSRESRQSELSKRSTVDPPAENTAIHDKRRGHARQASLNNRRVNAHEKKQNRRTSMHENEKKQGRQGHERSDSKHNSNESKSENKDSTSSAPISGTEVIQSLSATPLAGEGTTQAIAQLLGLTQEMNLNDGGGTTGDSKSGSKSSSHHKSVKSENTNATGKSGGKAKQHTKNVNTNNPNGETKQRRTTFSQDVQDISNGMKLNKKIQGDRERVDKIKAVKRGEVANEENENENKMDSELCAGAKPFVPGNTAQNQDGTNQQLQKKGSRGKKKKQKDGGENHQSTSANGKERNDQSDGTAATNHGNKQSKKKPQQQQQQQQNESASGVNLTLQAIQQSKQRKGPSTKQKKDKTVQNDGDAKRQSLDDKPKSAKEKKKSQPKEQPRPDVDIKQIPKKKDGKSKEKPARKQKKDKTTQNDANIPTSLSPAIPPNQPQTTNDLNYGAGRPIVVVHIAEKPSIAQVWISSFCVLYTCIHNYYLITSSVLQAIAQGLNGGGSSKSGGKSLPIHEFTNPPFPKAPKASKVTHRVSSVAGHVFNVDFPKEYQSWDTVDPAE